MKTSNLPIVASLILACIVSFSIHADPLATWRGPRGDGVFPAKDIVTSCDEATNKNIVWKTPLPFIGCNSPVYANGRVFVLTDAGWKSDAPLLHCLDVTDGKTLWTRTIDNLDARPKEVAEWARAQRKREMEMARRGRELKYLHDNAKDADEKASIIAMAEKEGFAIKKDKRGLNISITSTKMVFSPPHDKGQDYKRLVDEGLFWWEGWYYHSVIYTGSTFPSAVVDGNFVYAYTNNNAAACFDMEGNQKWLVDVRMPGGGHGSGPITTASPTIVGDTIILFKYDMAVALDKRNGKERWRHACQYKGAYQPGSAAVHFQLDGTDYVYLTSSEILRVSDGKVVGKLDHPADLAGKKRSHGPYFGAHSQSIARGDMIWVIHTGYGGGAGRALGGIFCFKLSKDGDKIVGKLQWQTEGGGDNFCIALDGDVLYIHDRSMKMVNATDGKVIGETKHVSHKAPAFAVTDQHIITLSQSSQNKWKPDPDYRGSGTLQFFDKKTLKQVGEGALLMDKGEGEVLKKRIARVAQPWWGWGRSSPTAWGNRVFVRSHDAVYCIGDPKASFEPASKTR